jgi:hypothetical protein
MISFQEQLLRHRVRLGKNNGEAGPPPVPEGPTQGVAQWHM